MRLFARSLEYCTLDVFVCFRAFVRKQSYLVCVSYSSSKCNLGRTGNFCTCRMFQQCETSRIRSNVMPHTSAISEMSFIYTQYMFLYNFRTRSRTISCIQTFRTNSYEISHEFVRFCIRIRTKNVTYFKSCEPSYKIVHKHLQFKTK